MILWGSCPASKSWPAMGIGTARTVQEFDEVLRANITGNTAEAAQEGAAIVVKSDLFNWKDIDEFIVAHGQFDLVVGADM